jgi:Tol biopolymer transport system component
MVDLTGAGHQLPLTGWYPSWSPDGTRITFLQRDDSGSYGLYVATPEGAGMMELYKTQITYLEGQHHLSWSPDSRQIAFADFPGSSPDISTVDAAGGGGGQLTFIGAASMPDWSPDGQTIVFSAREGGSLGPDIYALPAGGSGRPPDNLTGTPDVADVLPAWSPDGTSIAYAACRLDQPYCDLYVMASDGSGKQLLLSNQPVVMSLDWQPAQP